VGRTVLNLGVNRATDGFGFVADTRLALANFGFRLISVGRGRGAVRPRLRAPAVRRSALLQPLYLQDRPPSAVPHGGPHRTTGRAHRGLGLPTQSGEELTGLALASVVQSISKD
jgi:hypothetical protein